MNHDEVRELEEACEEALVEVLKRHFRHPLPPRTPHLMAKAAVTVLEAVVQNRRESEG
jgi:hypothetical protein